LISEDPRQRHLRSSRARCCATAASGSLGAAGVGSITREAVGVIGLITPDFLIAIPAWRSRQLSPTAIAWC
jgi:hypothetical protein